VRCRYSSGTTVDRVVYLSEALCDMATLPGLATVTDADTTWYYYDQIAVRPELPKSVRDGMIEIAGMAPEEVEYGFDLTPDGEDRFTYHAKPAACDWKRNSIWHYGDKAGEDATQLAHDSEACPDWILVPYLSSAVATVPDGSPRYMWYPSPPPADYAGSVATPTQYADEEWSDVDMAASAELVYNRIAASLWTGTVPIPFTITDVRGRVRGGWQVRPGDRLSVPSLDGANDLYVTEVSWDWSTLTGSATVGYPWDIESTGVAGTHVFVPGRPTVDPRDPRHR
jgi:hypothetical protein